MIVFHIAARELRGLFLSPLAWAILAVVQLILGYMFVAQLDAYLMLQGQLAGAPEAPGVTEIIVAPIYGNAAIVLLLVIPLLTMRLISEERRSQTISLLFSAPLSMSEIVIGKFLGILGFLFIMVAMLSLMPLSLLAGGSLDLGMFAAGALGLLLLLASFAAIGLYMSSLTAQPAVAAVTTFGALLLLWILDWMGKGGEQSSEVFGYLSMLRHYESLIKGMFDTSDVIYYLLFILGFIVLSIRRLDADRLQH